MLCFGEPWRRVAGGDDRGARHSGLPEASPSAQIAYIVFAGWIWPLTAFSIGLYRSDQLTAWASAVSEVPRAVVALLLITWSLFGIAALLGLDQVVALTFLTVAAIAALRRRSPAPASAPASTATPGAAPAHPDPRLGNRRRAGRQQAEGQRAVRTDPGRHRRRRRARRRHPRPALAGPLRRPRHDHRDAADRPRHHRLLARQPRAAARVDPRLPRCRRRRSTSCPVSSSSSTACGRSTRSAACRCSRSGPPT